MGNIRLELEIEDINLILESLGQLPFVRVYRLIGRIQEQAAAQAHAHSEPAAPGAGETAEQT